MSSASLDRVDGCWKLSGELGFSTVSALRERFRAEYQADSPTVIDLADVTRVDSAGVALMIDWLRYAKSHDRQLQFHNIPRQMASIADLCDVAELLNDSA